MRGKLFRKRMLVRKNLTPLIFERAQHGQDAYKANHKVSHWLFSLVLTSQREFLKTVLLP